MGRILNSQTLATASFVIVAAAIAAYTVSMSSGLVAAVVALVATPVVWHWLVLNRAQAEQRAGALAGAVVGCASQLIPFLIDVLGHSLGPAATHHGRSGLAGGVVGLVMLLILISIAVNAAIDAALGATIVRYGRRKLA